MFRGFLKLSTQVTKTVLMVDSTDHITGKTGLAAGITKYLSKAGGAPGAIAPTTAELDATNVKGIYSLVFTTTDTNTLGEFQLHLTAAGADPTDDWWEVVSYLPGEAATLQAGAITASVIATDAIGASQVAASAVTEIQTGLATAAALATVQADTDDIQARLPAALIAGRMNSSVGAMSADVITAAAIATDAIAEIQAGLATAAALATVQADTDDIQTRLPAALVAGRMNSSVGAMSADVITAAAIAPDAGVEFATAVWAATTRTLTASLDPSAAVIADAVWDELLAGHLAVGSAGAALNGAGSAGDPWTSPLPGAYGAGSAGFILGTNLDAKVSTRLATSSYTAPDNATITAIAGYVDTEVAAIKAKTDNLPAAPAAVGDIPTAAANANALLDQANGVESGLTLRQWLRLAAATLFGRASGMATTTAVFRDTPNTKNRVTATVDADGNRTAVTLDAT